MCEKKIKHVLIGYDKEALLLLPHGCALHFLAFLVRRNGVDKDAVIERATIKRMLPQNDTQRM